MRAACITLHVFQKPSYQFIWSYS